MGESCDQGERAAPVDDSGQAREADPSDAADPPGVGRWTGARLGLLVALPFAFLVRRFFAHTTDDAFIPLRYGWNVLQGDGFVFNVGERIEGVTSPLHLLVATVVVALPGGFTLLILKLVTLAFACAALWMGARLLVSAGFPTWAVPVGALLLGGNWILAFNAGNGLETAMTCLLVTATVAVLVRDGAQRWLLIGLLGAGAAISRPETVLIVASLGLSSLLLERGMAWWRRIRWTLVSGAIFTVVTLGRLAYYGELLPNTYYAKRVPENQVRDLGATYLRNAIQPGAVESELPASAFAAALFWVTCGLLIVGALGWVVRRHRMAHCVLPIGCQMYFAATVGGDWMPGGRFLAPVALLMVLAQLNGAVVLVRVAERWTPTPPTALRAAAAAGLVGLALFSISKVPAHPTSRVSGWDDRTLLASGGYGDSWSRSPETFRCARAGDLVVFSEMGYGPWQRTDLRFIDARGLITREIAMGSDPSMRHTWGVADPDWNDPSDVTVSETLRRRPEVVVTYSHDPPPTFGEGLYTTEGVESPVEGYTVYRRADVTCD